jgi:hypothetical protein
MADDALVGIDEAFAQARLRSARGIRQRRPQPTATPAPEIHAEPAVDRRNWWKRLTWIELFLAVQFLWGAILFVPGAQAFRAPVRALPYLSSLGLLIMYLVRSSPTARPRGSSLLVCAMLLLVANLLHPTTQLSAGIAQCVFQLSIVAPFFWAYKAIQSPKQMERVLILVFVMNLVSAGLGILQVYFPDRFMPPQFSLALSEDYRETLTYTGANGRAIVRPPGLTDTPGGAAVAGGLTALLGLGLCLRKRSGAKTVAILSAVAVGLAVVYLTQVRSVLLMVVAGTATLGVVVVRQGRVARAGWILGSAAVLIIGAFFWASSLGGESVEDRFLALKGQGALEAYQENRGMFLSYTVGELLSQYPLGAGVGRWGMMNTYFGDPSDFHAPPLYAEIQLTGWLLDGGWPMWILYGGALAVVLFTGFRRAIARDPELASVATVALASQVLITGMAMTGPAFNTQLGILFWTLAAGVHGAANVHVDEEDHVAEDDAKVVKFRR